MLILTRRAGESILIGENSEIEITYFGDNLRRGKSPQIRIGITAPKNIPIVRKEILGQTIKSKNKNNYNKIKET